MTENDREYPLSTIYLYLTDRCNLRCSHCWITPAHNRSGENINSKIDMQYLKKAIIDAKSIGLTCVKLTGGEPFLRKDILDLIDFLSSNDIIVDIETNGTLLNEEIVERLNDSSVNQVSVSLDGASEESHESIRKVAGCYQKALDGLSLLTKNDIGTQIIMSLYGGNILDIEKLADIADSMGVNSLKINPIMPTGRGKDLFTNEENLSVEKLLSINRWIEEELSLKYDSINICFDIPTGLKSLKSITSSQLYECNILNIIGILADGGISLCGIGQTETDLVMGNIIKDDIRNVWQNHHLLKKLRKDLPKNLTGICGRCIFKFRCLGACRASAYSLTGNLNSSFFLCDEAYKNGIFPKSRMIN
ncbi:MAG: radical SAM protein [Desulfobacterales bacterium]|nr:radical SAM protein [Desulfobacterales bacterium]